MKLSSRLTLALGVCLLALGMGCRPSQSTQEVEPTTPPSNTVPSTLAEVNPASLILAELPGEAGLLSQIRSLQSEIRSTPTNLVKLESLGWLFVSQARLTFDPFYYNVALGCALRIDELKPSSPEGLLLRGHVHHNLHEFAKAEAVARQLIAQRESPFDHGLLGDALLELGKMEEATDAYQTMMDLKPGLQSYTRASHLRWLMGDREGALEMARLAALASHPRDGEGTAWIYTRLAHLEWTEQNDEASERAVNFALSTVPNYAPGLLLQGRALMASTKVRDAFPFLEKARALNSSVDSDWALWEAANQLGKTELAGTIHHRITTQARNEPRSVSLFLATRNLEVDRAVMLAKSELTHRQDVYTHDALGWALTRSGSPEAALPHVLESIQWETPDPRIWLHAATTFLALKEMNKFQVALENANRVTRLLYPSELELLKKLQRLAPMNVSG